MIKDKKIFRNFIWNTVGSTLASFNSLFFLVAITRIGGEKEAGIFSICVATAFLLYIFAIYSGRNCHITDIKNEIKDKDYIVSRVITCIAMLVISIGFIVFNQYDTYKNAIIMALCIWKAVEAFGDVFYGVLQKNEKLYIVGQSLVVKSILGIILFILVYYFTHNLIYACSMLALVSIIVFVLFDLPQSLPYISKGEKSTKTNVIKIFKNEFFLFASAFLAMYLLNAPKYAIDRYLTDEIQGIFGMILMPASILPLFAQLVTAPMMNELTKSYKEKEYVNMKKTQRKLLSYIFGFGLLAIFVAYLIGIPVLNLIYKVDLSSYRISLICILFAYVIYAGGFVKTIMLTIYRKIKEQFFVYLISSIAVLILSNILVKTYGENGIIPTYIFMMIIYYILFSILITYQQNRKMRNHKSEEK